MASWSAIAEWKKREFWSFGFVFVFLVWLIGMLFLLFEKMKVAAECAFGFYKMEVLPQLRQMVVQKSIMFTSIQWGSNFWLLFCFMFSIIIN
jgi:hypothetical protein